MGVPPFLLADTLETTVAQRLIRLLCPACKQRQEFDPALFSGRLKNLSGISYHYVPRGCPDCYNTGFRGRKAVYEVVPLDEELAGHIRNRSSDIGELLARKGIKTLSENAHALFEQGLTSIEEIYSLLAN